jgi:signal transduction histidine kinase
MKKMISLREFLEVHREEIVRRSKERLASRNSVNDEELARGLSSFLDELSEDLRRASEKQPVDHADLRQSAIRHGHELFQRGVSVGQVVHEYGNICQVITGLASDLDAAVASDEFRTLNLCLDDAIAGAVTEHSRQRERAIVDEGTERLGVLAHEMRNALNAAMISFALIKQGVVAPGGSTSAIHERSLVRLNSLIARSLADVRLEAGLLRLERIPLWEVIEEAEISGRMMAEPRGIRLEVPPVDPTICVAADRQILAAALANLLQNAFKFTKPGTRVVLRTACKNGRVTMEIEDECGGLPEGAAASMLKPFVQNGRDRTGLGLGLAICIRAARSMAGELRVRDVPGKGCVFTVDLPSPPIPSSSRLVEPSDSSSPSRGAEGGPRRDASLHA